MVINMLFSNKDNPVTRTIQPSLELLSTKDKTSCPFLAVGCPSPAETLWQPRGQSGTEVKFKPTVYRAEMALAATLRPSGRVRSVMARTTLGLARAGSFTSSETCMHKKTNYCHFTASAHLNKWLKRHHVAQGNSKFDHVYWEDKFWPFIPNMSTKHRMVLDFKDYTSLFLTSHH